MLAFGVEFRPEAEKHSIFHLIPFEEKTMKKAVLSAIALAVGVGAIATSAQAKDRIGVTIYKYDDNFMSLMRSAIEKEAKHFKGVELLMND